MMYYEYFIYESDILYLRLGVQQAWCYMHVPFKVYSSNANAPPSQI